MIYYYKQFLAKHWHQLSVMLDSCYQTAENQKDTVIMGLHCHKSVEELKLELNTNNRVILYQTEPLIDGPHWHPIEKIINNIRGSDEVWDYDLENIDILRSHGIEAKFTPPAYTETLRRVNNVDNPDIDVLFYGSYSEYRYKMLHNLHMQMENNEHTHDFLMNRNIVWLQNVTDTQLDEFIGRSKIILNLKPFEHTVRQQQTRIYYPLINDKCVLSEKCNINYFGDNINEFDSMPELHEKVIHLLKDDNWRIRKPNHRGWIGAKDKSNIAIFYHVYPVNNWVEVFEEQICKLQRSGLYDEADYIHVGVNSENIIPYKFNKINRIKYNVNFTSEIDTLTDLYNFAKVNPNYKILYFHTKGVSFHGSEYGQNVQSWRRYMEHFNILRWRDCVNLLREYDCVGTEWEDMAYIANSIIQAPHYAGNFWWANSSYISKLDLEYLSENTDWVRYNCEFWLGSKNPNRFNFITTNLNKYENYMEPSYYGG